MKILLACAEDVALFGQTPSCHRKLHDQVDLGDKYFYRLHDIQVDLDQPDNADYTDYVVLPQLSLKVRNQLEQYRAVKHPTSSFPYTCFWNVFVGVGVSEVLTEDQTYLKGWTRVDGMFQDSCLSAIRDLYGTDAKIQFSINIAAEEANVKTSAEISTIEMELECSEPINMAFCQDSKMKFPPVHFSNWKSSKGLNAELKLLLCVEDDIIQGSTMPPISSVVSCANRKMLEEGILSDVTIVASNGASIKAHRNFLAVESPVFLTMFQTDMRESRESILEIPDMSEESVRNMLSHLYCKEMKLEDMNKTVAFELFHAGHKYGIGSMIGIMRRFILAMPAAYYDLETCVKLFVYARNLSRPDEELKVKAMHELRMFKSNLQDSPAIEELFKNQPKAALEILMYSLEV